MQGKLTLSIVEVYDNTLTDMLSATATLSVNDNGLQGHTELQLTSGLASALNFQCDCKLFCTSAY